MAARSPAPSMIVVLSLLTVIFLALPRLSSVIDAKKPGDKLAVTYVRGGSTHTVTIRYMTRKGSANAHAYDSLATVNATQLQALAQRCLGLKSCPTGAADTEPMDSDPNPVTPYAVGVNSATSAHELPPESRMWTLFGGTFVTGSSTVPVHTTDPADTSSDYAIVSVRIVIGKDSSDSSGRMPVEVPASFDDRFNLSSFPTFKSHDLHALQNFEIRVIPATISTAPAMRPPLRS